MAQKFYMEATQHSDSVLRAGLADLQDGSSPSAKVRGGALQSSYISSFTIPAKPQFGGGELKEAELDLYVTDVDYLAGSSRTPEFSIYKFKEPSTINEGPNGFFTEAMYGYGKASGSNNQYSDVVRGGEKLDGRNNIIVFSSTLNGMATLDESFNGKGNSFSDGGEYIAAGRTLFQDSLSYTTPKAVDDYAVRAWGESWLGSWAIATDEQYTIAEIKDIYAYPAEELGLGAASKANVTGMVIPIADKALHSNSGHTKAVIPKDDKEGISLYFDDSDWSKCIFSGNRNVIDAEAYGDEVTPSNSMFEIVTTAHSFFEAVEASGEGSTLKATGDIKYSSKTYLTGGQSAELFTYWDNEGVANSLGAPSAETIDYKKGTSGTQNRQEVMLAKKWIPYPMTHPRKTYRPNQNGDEFSNVIEIDLNIEGLEYAYACGDGAVVPANTNEARWINLRRSIVVCFGEEEPKAGMTLYDYVKLHSSTDGTQTAVSLTSNTAISSNPIACNNYAATGAKNFAAFAIVNTNAGIKVIPSCTHPSIGSHKLGRHSASALSGHTPSNFIWHVSTTSKDVWIADDNYMNKDVIEDLTGNWVKFRVCISESGGPTIWMGDENAYLSWGTDTLGDDDGSLHWVGARPTFGSLLMTLGDKDEMIGQTGGSPLLSAVSSGGFGVSLSADIPQNDFPLCNWKLEGNTTTSKVGQNISPTNYMKHMVIFVCNFKENIGGSGETKTDEYMKESRPTTTKVFIDSIKFKNFNYAINNASRGREWNKHPDTINIEPSSAIIGPHGRPSALTYKNPDAEAFAALTLDTEYLEYNNMGKLGAYRDVAPTMLSFGFESVTGRYHWRFNGHTAETDVDDMPWLRPYTPMMYFSGFTSPNLGNMTEIPTGNMLFTYTSAGDKANYGDIIFGKTHASKETLMGLGLAKDANGDPPAGAQYTSNISSLPINDHGWMSADYGSDSRGYPNVKYTSLPTIALKDFYTGFHLNADVNSSPTFVLKSHVHGAASISPDSPEYFQQCLPIRAGDIVKIGDVHASQQNTLTVDTIAHTGTAYIQNNDAANGLTMVTTGNTTGSLTYDAVYTQPEGSIRNWSSKGFAQMSVMAGGDTSADTGDQWTLRENSSASARITDIVSSEGKLILQVDTLKPLLLNPTDRFIVYIYRDSADPADFGYIGDSIQPTGDPTTGGGCRNYRLNDTDGYTLTGATTYNSSCKPNLLIESLDTQTNQITLIWDGYAADGTTKLIRYPNIPKLMISAYKQWIHGNVACENLETIHSATYSGIKFNSNDDDEQDYLRRVGDDRVSSIALATAGTGYSGTPTVVFSAPTEFNDPGQGTWSQLATATAVMTGAGDEVASITLNTKGFGYIEKPTVTFTGGGASTQATVIASGITMDTADGISFTNAKWNSRSMGLFSQGIKKGDRIVIEDNTTTGAENSGVYSVERATPNRLYFGKYHSGWLRRSSDSDGAVTITKLEPTQALSSRSYRSVTDLQSPFVVKKEQLTTPTEDNPVMVIAATTGMSSSTTSLTLTRSVISGSSPTWTSLVGQHIMIDDEIMFVKSLGSPDTTTVNVFRGQMRTNTYVDGVSSYGEGAGHKQGAKVYLVDLHLGGSGEELTALDSSSAANSGDHTQRIINARNLGATYAASQLNFAPDAGGIYGAYLNRWKPYTLPDDESSLQLKTDFGFGSYEQDKDDGGQVAKGVIKGTGYNEFKMEKLIEGGGVKALDTVNFLVTYSDTGTPHEVTINTRDAEDDKPILFAIYEDGLPIAPTLKVVPYEEDAQLPLFTWEASDSDLWYGILHVDNTNIYNQYHNRELHFPLNDGGIHKRVPSIVKVNGSNTNIDIGSSVRVDRGGLAEYALRFDGEENYLLAGVVDPAGSTTLEGDSASLFDAELDIGDRIIVGAVQANYEERTVASITDYNTLTVDTAFSNTDNDTAPLRLHGNFIRYGTGSVDPTPNCTSEMSIVVHITPDSDISGVSSIVSQRRKFSLELDANKKVVASLYYYGSGAVILTSSTIVTADGITPTAIKVTFDKNIKSGNVKLFINGQLEDQSGLITASGSTNNWKNDTNVVTTTAKVYIGAPQTELTTSIKNTMDAFTFKGLIEELVIYKSCIYPVVPQDQKFIFTKYLTEIENGSSVSYQARLFIKDYHNIRGSTPDEVAVSAPVSWRKAAFRLVD